MNASKAEGDPSIASVYADLADFEQGSGYTSDARRTAALDLNSMHAISMPLDVQNSECGFRNFTLLSTLSTRHVDNDVDRVLVVDFIEEIGKHNKSYAKKMFNKSRRLAVSTRVDVDRGM